MLRRVLILRIAVRTGVLAALVLVVGLLATPPVSARSSAAPGTVTLVPAAASTASATSRPPNGTILYAGISGGLGALKIDNSRNVSQDAVVTLVLGPSKAISVYVRAGSSTTVGNIKNGTYTIYFTTGSPFSFSVSKGRFTSGAAYWRFNDRLLFVPPPDYDVWTLTLYPVPNGNAPTTPINPGDYPA
jgi:hypothetical protein